MTNNPTPVPQELSPEIINRILRAAEKEEKYSRVIIQVELNCLIREAEQRGAESMRERAAQVVCVFCRYASGGEPLPSWYDKVEPSTDGTHLVVSNGEYGYVATCYAAGIRELTTTEAHSAMADSPEYPTAEVAEAHARATQAKIDKALEWYQETIIGDSPSKGETD